MNMFDKVYVETQEACVIDFRGSHVCPFARDLPSHVWGIDFMIVYTMLMMGIKVCRFINEFYLNNT